MTTDPRLLATPTGIAVPTVAPVRPLVVVRSPAITLVRSAAAVLILLGYLVGLWLDQAGQQPWLLDELRRWVTRPLGLGEDLGPLGLMLLLAAAGYAVPGRSEVVGIIAGVVTSAVVVPLWVARGAWPAAGSTTTDSAADSAPWGLAGDLLTGRPVVPLTAAVLLAALGWLWLSALMRLSRRLRWLAHCAQLVTALSVIALATVAEPLAPIAVALAFHSLVVVGQVVRGVRLGALGSRTGLALTLAACAVMVIAARALPAMSGWWYPLTMVYAIMLFAIATTFAGRSAAAIAANAVVRWLSDRVWPLLVFIGAVGYPVAGLLGHVVPAGVAVLAGVLATAACADVAHRAARLVTGGGQP